MTMAARDRPKRVARKLIQETSPMKRKSPSKRTLMAAGIEDPMPTTKKPKISEDEDSPSSLTTNSFYGRKTKGYVTPLDRKLRRESQESDSSEYISQSSVENDVQDDLRKVKRIKSQKNGASEKSTSRTSQTNVLKAAHKRFSGIKCGSPKSPVNSALKLKGYPDDSPESTVSSDASSEKKFFKSRTPKLSKNKNNTGNLGKKKLSSSASKMTQKGLKMMYKPASMKNRVTPSSPDIKWKKRSLDSNPVRRSPRKQLSAIQNLGRNAADLYSHSDDSELESSDGRVILRLSPRKQFNGVNSPGNDTESNELFSSFYDSQSSASHNEKPADRIVCSNQETSPKSQSSCTDSVLLLSEVETESNASRSPGKKTNKLHPFFNQGTPQHTKKSVSETSSRCSTPQSIKSKTLTPSSSPKNRSGKLKDDKDQYIIDAGQKMKGVEQCKSCGLTYNPKDGTDSATHQKLHTKVMNTLRFPGWRKERIAQDFLDGSRIIIVMADEKQAMKKVNAVKEIVDNDLGFVVDSGVSPFSQIYMFISDDKRIVGFCIAEKISSAYRMIAGNSQSASPVSPSDSSQPWCCSTEPVPAKCGINRIWVLKSERRKGIARKLLDAVKCNFMMGLVLKKSDMAFTDPTPDGRNFAASYTKTPSFLVYKHSRKKLSQ